MREFDRQTPVCAALTSILRCNIPLLAGRDDVIEVEMDEAVAYDVDTAAALTDG